MSDLLQSGSYSPGPLSGELGLNGQHPDADQLNAFVEGTLPEHERLEALAHLADCADCREIVSLSLPPLEDAAAVEPAPVVGPRVPVWLAGLISGWKVVWIAAPALAGLVLLTFYLRKPAATQHPSGQIADSRPPARPSPPPTAAGPESPKPSPTPKAAPGRPTEDKVNPKPVVEQPRRIEDRPVNGRESVIPKPPPVPAAPVNPSPLKAAPAKASQAAGGPEPLQRSVARTAPRAGASLAAPRAPVTASGFLREPPRGATVVPITPMAPAASESASAPDGGGQPSEVNQSVVFATGAAANVNVAADSSAMTVNAQSSALDAVIAARDMPENAAGLAPLASTHMAVQAPLPSGLAVLSLAANLHRRLALDTRNQLFFSPDDGQHWTPVSAVWRGRAVTVATVPVAARYTSARTPTLALAVPERYTPGATASEQSIAGSASSVSGAVMDASGAVIPGATVSATDSRTALVRTVQTDASGRYLVQELPPGVYRLEARASGFATHSQVAVVGESQQAIINIALAVGQMAQTVAVEAAPPVQLHTFSRNMLHGKAKARNAIPPAAIDTLSPLFVITTDAGGRWASTDGQSWKQE